MQTVERIVEVLEEAGIDHLFGIPGGDTGRIFKALYDKQDKIKVVVARDEQTAACMAAICTDDSLVNPGSLWHRVVMLRQLDCSG
jgi:thiamine pyrophosphate-dependent acetolactate synthase large subunit-like protein